MNLPTMSIASAGNGSLMNCEKNFQFLACSIALFDGGWSRAKVSAQLPAWTETLGLPTDSTGASSSLASAGDPDCEHSQEVDPVRTDVEHAAEAQVGRRRQPLPRVEDALQVLEAIPLSPRAS